MLKKKPIALDQFTVQISNPKNRMTVTQATVYEDGRFSVNSRLAEIIYKKAISISFTSDGRYLAIRETENEENMSFPKSGTKILKEASDFLQEKKRRHHLSGMKPLLLRFRHRRSYYRRQQCSAKDFFPFD